MAITLDGSNLTTVGVINSATAQNSTSGTSIDFTGIPAGVKRITVMFSGVSTNGSSVIVVRLGTSGGIQTTSYLCGVTNISGATPNSANQTAGFPVNSGQDAGMIVSGSFSITNITSNTWTANGVFGRSDVALTSLSGGSVALSGTLTQVRITTVNGTDTFDAGSINILYE